MGRGDNMHRAVFEQFLQLFAVPFGRVTSWMFCPVFVDFCVVFAVFL